MWITCNSKVVFVKTQNNEGSDFPCSIALVLFEIEMLHWN